MNSIGCFWRFSMLRVAPVLLPLAIIVVTGIQGLDFGNHWDEKGYQLVPVKTIDRKSTRLNSSHIQKSRMPSSA